jgi:glycine oxidase
LKIDYLIVGQGLAGSLLAWHLLERGQQILVLDRDQAVTASKVAAGLVTPISGQQFSLPADIHTTLDLAQKTYRAMEARLGEVFYHDLPIVRLFQGAAEVSAWQKRLHNPERAFLYRDFYRDLAMDADLVHAEHGGFELQKGGWLNVRRLLEKMKEYLLLRNSYRVAAAASREVVPRPGGGVGWQEVTARQIIFCEGWQARENHYFSNIPMNNARGDILRIHCQPLAEERRILNRNGWLLPLGDGVFRAGASYDHSFADENPQPGGRREVEQKISGIIKPAFSILAHEAAIRPIIKRSQIYMGRHPLFPDLIYFNGMGSKGALNGPIHTLALVEHLLTGKPVAAQNDIARHFVF